MIVQSIAFYVFSVVLVASCLMVISARNPVHSDLFLILAFFQAAGLAVILGAEFLAMTLIIVYVGAVAVLFLFVVMMLDINFRELRGGFMRHAPIGGLVGLILLAELTAVFTAWTFSPDAASLAAAPTPDVLQVTNTQALGRLLYTQYIYLFQACGIVLLVAMIGAIVLTLRSREGVRKQNVGAQLARSRSEAMAIRKVPTGEGV